MKNPPARTCSVNGRVRYLALTSIQPGPENEKLYRPVLEDDPEIVAIAESIREYGIREPIVVTLDHWILSGHRRHVAAGLVGLKRVPVRYEPIRREDDID